jgi:hypothetical protein
MASFNERNTQALSFLSGLSQGFAPAYLGARRQAAIEDVAQKKLAGENARLIAKLDADKRLAAQKRRDNWKQLIYKTQENARLKGDELKAKETARKEDQTFDKTESALDRASRERIAKLNANKGKDGGLGSNFTKTVNINGHSVPLSAEIVKALREAAALYKDQIGGMGFNVNTNQTYPKTVEGAPEKAQQLLLDAALISDIIKGKRNIDDLDKETKNRILGYQYKKQDPDPAKLKGAPTNTPLKSDSIFAEDPPKIN